MGKFHKAELHLQCVKTLIILTSTQIFVLHDNTLGISEHLSIPQRKHFTLHCIDQLLKGHEFLLCTLRLTLVLAVFVA